MSSGLICHKNAYLVGFLYIETIQQVFVLGIRKRDNFENSVDQDQMASEEKPAHQDPHCFPCK